MRCLATAVAGLALLTAGCGSSPAAPAAAGSAVAFTDCMRSHRVPADTDPSSNGLLPKKTPQQLVVSTAQLDAAERACIHLAPNRGAPTPAQVAAYRSQMLVYARCIRAHGVPNMPDPDSRGHLDIGPGTGVDIDGAAFQAAYRTCQKDLHP